jgi:predicted NAD/FAD-binding protein
MRIAVIGAGVSGLVCALRLRESHDVTVFEAGARAGGHTNTVDVEVEGKTIPVDTGFIVFNERNYPNFCALLDELGVASAPSEMSFSVRDDECGVEWGGRSARGLFAQRRNLASPSHWRFVRDLLRFGRLMREAVADADEALTLGEFLEDSALSSVFAERYLVPMGAAIWSAPTARMRAFPLRAFVEFFDNHGMLEPWRAPQWKYVVGGSQTYVRAICGRLGDAVRSGCAVERVERAADGVAVRLAGGQAEWFDEVVLACHSDQALRMLGDDATRAERDVLGAIEYQANEAVLHTDAALLPKRKRAWSAWNFLATADGEAPVAVTYHMNLLQKLPTATPVNVTLNATERIDPAKVIRAMRYDHPVYTGETFGAQRRWSEVSGVDRVHLCGAYWGWGFHEDGVKSGLRVVESINARTARERVVVA